MVAEEGKMIYGRSREGQDLDRWAGLVVDNGACTTPKVLVVDRTGGVSEAAMVG